MCGIPFDADEIAMQTGAERGELKHAVHGTPA